MTAVQYHDLRQLLCSISERLGTLEPSDITGHSAWEVLNSAMLAIAFIRIWMEGFGFVNVDCKRLSRRSLLALTRDPAVPLSAKREIEVLLRIRALERAIDRAFRSVDDAGETGVPHET
jgi:hypothetical protein